MFGTVMGEEWFAPWGYVAFRNIPVGIEGAASLWSKGVRNLSTPLGEIISPDGVVYCHPIFQGKSFFKAYGVVIHDILDLKWGKEYRLESCPMRRHFAYQSICQRVTLRQDRLVLSHPLL